MNNDNCRTVDWTHLGFVDDSENVEMPGESYDSNSSYGYPTAFIYIFNLIVGAGALSLPKAFHEVGWLIGTILFGVLSVLSYITMTYMVEVLAISNAYSQLMKGDSYSEIRNEDSSTADPAVEYSTPLVGQFGDNHAGLFSIVNKYEMGTMAKLFYNKIGMILFYLIIALYLYGDLAIYSSVVPRSLYTVVCGNNITGLRNITFCTSNSAKTIQRYFLIIFFGTLGPMVFFNVQKTKYLQMATTLCRWLAFLLMIILAIVRCARKGNQSDISTGNFGGVPFFFGSCVYSFMCQHSLPSLVTPMQQKRRLHGLLLIDVAVVLGFYLMLVLTASFAFRGADLNEVYALNFWGVTHPVIEYFLALFPVFTLSTSFPIIGITLRENLKCLLLSPNRQYHVIVPRVLIPLLVLLPAFIIVLFINDISLLVGITGSYAGNFIQYAIPATLVFCARRTLTGGSSALDWRLNPLKSPFSSRYWILLILCWSVLCMAVSTAFNIISLRS